MDTAETGSVKDDGAGYANVHSVGREAPVTLPLDAPKVDGLRSAASFLADLKLAGVTIDARLLLALLDVYGAAQDVVSEGAPRPLGARAALADAVDWIEGRGGV